MINNLCQDLAYIGLNAEIIGGNILNKFGIKSVEEVLYVNVDVNNIQLTRKFDRLLNKSGLEYLEESNNSNFTYYIFKR